MTTILDFGAGDATKNDITLIKNMMDDLPWGVTVKFQLFKKIPGLTPLDPHVFMTAWAHGQKRGIPVTSSVFDPESLHILLRVTKVPFIKIACNEKWYPLIDEIPPFVPVLVSVDSHVKMIELATQYSAKTLSYLHCIPEYPAEYEDYEHTFTPTQLRQGISDHTTTPELVKKYRPKLWERHYGDYGPDAIHAITKEELIEVLNAE